MGRFSATQQFASGGLHLHSQLHGMTSRSLKLGGIFCYVSICLVPDLDRRYAVGIKTTLNAASYIELHRLYESLIDFARKPSHSVRACRDIHIYHPPCCLPWFSPWSYDWSTLLSKFCTSPSARFTSPSAPPILSPTHWAASFTALPMSEGTFSMPDRVLSKPCSVSRPISPGTWGLVLRISP